MPHEHPHQHPANDPRVDPGSFMLGVFLARLEGKIDRLTHQVGQVRATGLSTHARVEQVHARVEQIAQALEIGREAGSLTYFVEKPRQEK